MIARRLFRARNIDLNCRIRRIKISATLRLDPKNSTAYMALATVLPSQDYAGRERLLAKAVNADPLNCGCEYAAYAELLMQTGRIAAAARMLKAASDTMPVDPSHAVSAVAVYRMLGRFDESNRIAAQFRPLWPEALFHRALLRNAFDLHQVEVVRSLVASSAKADPLTPEVREAYLSAADALASNNISQRRAAADRIERLVRGPTLSPTLVELLGLLGRDAAAADAMNRIGKADPERIFLAYAPELAGARQQPAMHRLFEDARLIEYWKSSGNMPDFCKTERVESLCGQPGAKRLR